MRPNNDKSSGDLLHIFCYRCKDVARQTSKCLVELNLLVKITDHKQIGQRRHGKRTCHAFTEIYASLRQWYRVMYVQQDNNARNQLLQAGYRR